MKKKTNLFRSALQVSLVTLFVLSIPFTAMQFANQLKWNLFDFIIMGVLIFSTGFLYILLARLSSNIIYRVAVALTIISTFLLIWVNLAVGLIGSGPNAANLMYISIVAIIIAGTFLSHFTIRGMERVTFTAAIALVLFIAIQLLAKMYQYPGSSVFEVIAVNAFFAILFAASGLLFHITLKHLPGNTNKTVQQ